MTTQQDSVRSESASCAGLHRPTYTIGAPALQERSRARQKQRSFASRRSPARKPTCSAQSADQTRLLRLWHRAARLRVAASSDIASSACRLESERAWEQLADAIEPFLRTAVCKRRGYAPWCEVDEVVQEVYVTLLRDRGRVMRRCRARLDSQLRKYLAGICESRLIDMGRRALTEKRGHGVVVHGDCGWLENHEDPKPSALVRKIDRERLNQFSAAVRECAHRTTRNPARTCDVLQQSLFGGDSCAEIAERLGVNKSAISSMVSRMRRKLTADGWKLVCRN